ncbi:MAG: RNA polymerase sigma factor [Pseudonocardiales bacterium]|nr:RNA polymerase sigma factor [Pseudonocardiales bacterium]
MTYAGEFIPHRADPLPRLVRTEQVHIRRALDIRRPLEPMPDDMLLAGLATGDPQLAVAFVRRFQQTVFGVALAVVGDSGLAEDIAQQAFERAWRHAAVYDPRRGSVRTWLTRIVHNLAVDAVRVRRPAPLDPQDLIPLLVAMTEGPEHRALAGETSTELRKALATLPPEQARAVVLAAVHGLTAREIAEAESIPIGTAKSRIRAAMAKLHTALSPERADHD